MKLNQIINTTLKEDIRQGMRQHTARERADSAKRLKPNPDNPKAPPLNLGGIDGMPIRPLLLKAQEGSFAAQSMLKRFGYEWEGVDLRMYKESVKDFDQALKEDINHLPQIVFLIGSLYYMAGLFGDVIKGGASEYDDKKRQKIKQQQQQIKDRVEIETQKVQQHFPNMGPEEIAKKAFQIIDDNRKNEIKQKVMAWVDE